jgi:hypothetical protein
MTSSLVGIHYHVEVGIESVVTDLGSVVAFNFLVYIQALRFVEASDDQ